MANIAQVVNVLQSMILTNDKGIVLTPTYHVFEMYKKFQDATFLPMDLKCDSMQVRDNRMIPMISASAAREKNSNTIVVSLVNVSLDKAQEISFNIDGATAKTVSGRILTCKDIKDYNDFTTPETVKPVIFNGAKVSKSGLKVKIPAKSVVVLELK